LSGALVTITNLLNTDVNDLGQWFNAGLRWWLDELAGMLPASARGAFEGRPSLTAELTAGGGYRLSRHGRTVMESPGAVRRRPVTLRLPREAALVVEVPAPPLAQRDLRRMLELDIDRLTPFRTDQVFVDVVTKDAGPGRAIVAAILRDEAEAAIASAQAAGLDPQALTLAADAPAEQAIDFLPKMREAGVVPRGGSGARLIWAAVGVLLLANLAAFIGRDMWEVSNLRAQVDAQRPAVSQVMAVRRQVQAEDQRRADILARRTTGEPLRMLDAVTTATPSGAWVDRMVFDGQSVRLSGFRQDQIDVAAALKASPALTNVRRSGGEVLTRQTAGQPFDLTADIKKPVGG
jgi:Tfp pilus assembly protein PilN